MLEIVVSCWLAAALGVLVWWLGPRVAWRPVVGRRVVVNLKSGRAVDGVLVRRSAGLLFIKNGVALEPGAEPAAVEGQVVILAAEIDFIQAL